MPEAKPKRRFDSTRLTEEEYNDLPLAIVSEARIAEKAPAAISALRQFKSLDLADMLGLTPYLEGSN